MHGPLLAAIQSFDTAQRKFAITQYRLMSALAANLKDSLAHQVGLDMARSWVYTNLDLLEEDGQALTDYDQICDAGAIGTQDPASGSTKTPASPACPSGISGPGFAVNLLVFSFSVSCEQVTIQATAGEGWLNAFASYSHNFKNGSNTIYAGPQVGVSVGVGPFQGGANARGGVYVTFAADGSVQDLGLRAVSSAGATIGRVSTSISGPHASISIAGASAPTT